MDNSDSETENNANDVNETTNTEPDAKSELDPEAELDADADVELDADAELDAEADDNASDIDSETELEIPQEGLIENLNENVINLDQDDDDDSMSDNYEELLDKFNKQYTNNILENYHNEEFHINPDEMQKLCQLKKNDNGLIDDPLHKSSPILSKYEYTNIIGIRSKQLSDGAMPLTDIPNHIMDNYIIADIELRQKILPFVIKRPLGHGGCEYWKLSDLEILL